MPDESTPNSTSRRHCCATCSKCYSTNSHLRRHQVTHTGRSALTCPSCSRSFLRVDVARRHTKTCSKGGAEIVFPRSKRGKQRRSCDRCSKRRISCDAAVPCTRCSSAALECTYQRLTVGAFSPLTLSKDDENDDSSLDAVDGTGRDCTRIPIDFLLGFTDPSPYRTSAAVIADDVAQCDERNETWNLNLQSYSNNDLLLGDLLLWDEEGCFPTFFEALSPGLGEGSIGLDFSQTSCEAVLAHRANEMISQLSMTSDFMKKKNPEAPANFNQALAEFVFTETNLRQFVRAYFHRLHWYNPIIHRPTFDMETSYLPLLLAVFLFGSLCCAPEDAALSAREFFDLAEEYIFSQLTMKRLLVDRGSCTGSGEEVEILQAALTIELVQNGSSDIHTRRRLRLERHPCLVAAMRISSLIGAKRRFPLHELAGVDWQAFIFDEMRLRLATWVFFADSIFAVFYNKSPEVMISEMTGDFPCDENVFEAETASEYERSASRLASAAANSQSLSQIASFLLSDMDPGVQVHSDVTFTAAQLLFGIGALQSIAMASRSILLGQAGAETIINATNRWKVLWDAATEGRARHEMRLTGFISHADELWWLTRTIAKMVRSGDSSCQFAQFVPTDSVKELHELICRFQDWG